MNVRRHFSILAIIVVCALVFGWEQVRGISLSGGYGATPAVIVNSYKALAGGDVSIVAVAPLGRLVTALFLHGDVEHILYNMVFLWAFGYLASQHLGQWWALAAFLLTGACGNVLQVMLNPESLSPIIGASGAVCGFEGIYLGLALRWRLPWPDVWPLAHPIPPLQLGAFALVGFGIDMYYLTDHAQHIAFGAHIGGFLSGLAAAAILTTIYPTGVSR
jgi:membrane associated rhomboid family serine protease